MQQRWLRAVVITGALAVLGFATAMPALAQSSVAWLGVYSQTLNADLRDGLDYDGDGVLVSDVVEDGPADRAGVRKGDIIVSFNSRGVESSSTLTRLVRDARVGQEVSLVVWRDGQRRTLTPRLGTRPSGMDDTPRARILRGRDDADDDSSGEWVAPEPPVAPLPPKAPRAPKTPKDAPEARVYVYEDKDGGDWEENENGDGRHDIEIRGLDKLHELEGLRGLRGMTMNIGRPRLGITMEDASGGVRITDVLDDTPAARAGLREGDVIVRVGDAAIGDTEDLGRAVRNAPAGPLSIEVRRNGTRRTLEADLGPARDGDDVRRQIERELRVPGNGKTRVYRFEAPTPMPERGAMRWRPRDSDELRREIADLRRRLEQLERQLEEQGDDR